jgi:hypothetical protein
VKNWARFTTTAAGATAASLLAFAAWADPEHGAAAGLVAFVLLYGCTLVAIFGPRDGSPPGPTARA